MIENKRLKQIAVIGVGVVLGIVAFKILSFIAGLILSILGYVIVFGLLAFGVYWLIKKFQ